MCFIAFEEKFALRVRRDVVVKVDVDVVKCVFGEYYDFLVKIRDIFDIEFGLEVMFGFVLFVFVCFR